MASTVCLERVYFHFLPVSISLILSEVFNTKKKKKHGSLKASERLKCRLMPLSGQLLVNVSIRSSQKRNHVRSRTYVPKLQIHYSISVLQTECGGGRWVVVNVERCGPQWWWSQTADALSLLSPPSTPLVPSIRPFPSHLFLLGLSSSPSGRPDLLDPLLITRQRARPCVHVCPSHTCMSTFFYFLFF